ncbi:MAG: bifunctional UDP-N-acetylglucosamine diphosphorylase/glucosamine-1-phosphate N-acetyltransferase GlmU [Proteobacteria bacterium]|nr:bifunctional UDP-N-acetylglucosamine diphosphorylase/glucosamine-1-phosphate N-acetyltransferase GlmU [Pseudomonadota bacterium]
MATALIILAAGQGTRMNSDLPKVLHQIAGAPLLHHAMRSGAMVEPERMVVVAGHGADEVTKAAKAFDEAVDVVIQAEQKGTAHAVLQALPALEGFEGKVIVLYGDTPLIRPETLEAMLSARSDVVVLGFEAADPGRYGRLVVHLGHLYRIIEYKDATAEERKITLCNSGVICADAKALAKLVRGVGNNNASGEYYLTDIIAAGRVAGLTAEVVTCPEAETLGVNSRADLAAAEAAMQARLRAEVMENGVTLTAPETVFLSWDTVIGRDTVVGPHVVFGPETTVESEAEILPFCHLEGCHISRGARVGPFARLRPGAELAEDVHVGNFVEVKNSILDEGVKVGHLTYLGDAHVGEHTNIGAGTITCNYDGVSKHRTEIGARAFIGSDTMLVAPVTIGDGAMTASGSVITDDVPENTLAVARARQVNKLGLAAKLFELFKSRKEKKQEKAQ